MRRFILVACLLLPAMGAWGQGTSDPMTLKFPLPVRPPPPGETPAPGRTPAEAPPPAVSRPAVAAAPAAPIAAPGAQPLTIGMLLTLSGPGAILGQHARDGFELALKQRGGRLGGRVVNLVVVDDEQKPDVAVARATRLVEQDKAEFVVGPIFSTVLGAIFRPVTGAGVILISPSAGSSAFAGKACSPNFFVTSYENSQVDQVLGQFAQSRGLKRAFVLAPDDQAGRDAVAGFKSRFKGEVLDQDLGPPGPERPAVEQRHPRAAAEAGREREVGGSVAVQVAERGPQAATEVRIVHAEEAVDLHGPPAGERRAVVHGDDRAAADVRGDDQVGPAVAGHVADREVEAAGKGVLEGLERGDEVAGQAVVDADRVRRARCFSFTAFKIFKYKST